MSRHPDARAVARAVARSLVAPMALVVTAAALQWTMARSGLTEGLVTPEGRVSMATALLLLSLLGLRLVALFVALPLAVFRLTRAALDALAP